MPTIPVACRISSFLPLAVQEIGSASQNVERRSHESYIHVSLGKQLTALTIEQVEVSSVSPGIRIDILGGRPDGGLFIVS